MQKRVFRGLLIAYPFVAGVLYLLLAYGPSQHLSRLQSEVKRLKEAKPAVIQRTKLKDRRESQIREIRKRLAELRRRANNMSLADAPTYIHDKAAGAAIAPEVSDNSEAAEDTEETAGGLKPENIITGPKTRENGWLYSAYGLKVNGPFYALVGFLRSMEQDEEHFVRVRQAALTRAGSDEEAELALEAEVDILLEIPPVPEELKTGKEQEHGAQEEQ